MADGKNVTKPITDRIRAKMDILIDCLRKEKEIDRNRAVKMMGGWSDYGIVVYNLTTEIPIYDDDGVIGIL